MTKEEQEQRFRTFVQGDILAQRLPNIHSGHPIVVRAPGLNEPWQLTSAQLEAIVREYHPDLSATASGPTCVIFYEKDGPTDAPTN